MTAGSPFRMAAPRVPDDPQEARDRIAQLEVELSTARGDLVVAEREVARRNLPPAPRISRARANAVLAAIRAQEPWLEVAGVVLAADPAGGYQLTLTAQWGYTSPEVRQFQPSDSLAEIKAWAATLWDRLGLHDAKLGVDGSEA